MIETKDQREKRIKAEAGDRAARAAKQEKWLAEQRAAKVPHAGAPADPNAPMSVLAAKTLTKRIKDHLEGAAALIVEAHKKEAWRVLSYGSWREYATKEFGISQSRAYQLLDHAETVETIEKFHIVEKPECEAQTRPLATLKPTTKKRAWKKALEIAGNGKPTAAQVTAAVNQIKPAKAKVVSTSENLPMSDFGDTKLKAKTDMPTKITDDTTLELSGMVSNRVTELTGQPITESEDAHLAIQIGLWLKETLSAEHFTPTPPQA